LRGHPSRESLVQRCSGSEPIGVHAGEGPDDRLGDSGRRCGDAWFAGVQASTESCAGVGTTLSQGADRVGSALAEHRLVLEEDRLDLGLADAKLLRQLGGACLPAIRHDLAPQRNGSRVVLGNGGIRRLDCDLAQLRLFNLLLADRVECGLRAVHHRKRSSDDALDTRPWRIGPACCGPASSSWAMSDGL